MLWQCYTSFLIFFKALGLMVLPQLIVFRQKCCATSSRFVQNVNGFAVRIDAKNMQQAWNTLEIVKTLLFCKVETGGNVTLSQAVNAGNNL